MQNERKLFRTHWGVPVLLSPKKPIGGQKKVLVTEQGLGARGVRNSNTHGKNTGTPLGPIWGYGQTLAEIPIAAGPRKTA